MAGSRTAYRPSRVISAALFTVLAVGWTSSGDDEVGASFGYAVVGADVNGDGYMDVVVGAPFFSTTNAGAGRAYVFFGSAAGPSETAAWTFSPSEMGSQYAGASLAVGDVNDDGYDDLVVGAPSEGDRFAACAGFFTCSLPACAGTAYLFLGSASGLGDTPAWTSYGNGVAGERFGAALATGDVNGDGYDDLVVGADNFDGAPSTTCAGTGSAYMFLGGPSGLSPSASWTSSGDAVARAEYGDAVSIGDVNGDGYDDVVVGAPMGYATPTTGRVFVYSGSPSGPASVAAWTADGSAGLGDALAAEGDLDGDGYDDLVVRGSLGSASELVHVYPGSAAGLPASPVRSLSGEIGRLFGLALSTAGDVNGDGYDDLLVGAFTALSGAAWPSGVGGAFLYLGGPFEGLAPTLAWASDGEGQVFASYGAAVSIAGDVNRDGYADVLVGASLFTTANEDAGKAYVYFGANAPSGLCDPAGVACDDGDPCTAESACDLAGVCIGTSPAPAETPCDDGDPITTGDVCDGAGVCRGEAPGSDGGPDPDAGALDGGAEADAAVERPPASGGCACAVSGPRASQRSTYALVLALLLAAHRGARSAGCARGEARARRG